MSTAKEARLFAYSGTFVVAVTFAGVILALRLTVASGTLFLVTGTWAVVIS